MTQETWKPKRLRELAAEIVRVRNDGADAKSMIVQIMERRCEDMQGILADVAPVMAAARATQAETHEWYCSASRPCPLCQTLRDALSALEED